MHACGDNPFPIRHFCKKPPDGFEPSTCGLQNRCQKSVRRDNKTTYDNTDPVLTDLLTDISRIDPDLAVVVKAWPELPEPVRVGIVAMVKAAKDTKGRG